MTQFILALDHDTIQEIKDHAASEVLVDSLFDSDDRDK